MTPSDGDGENGGYGGNDGNVEDIDRGLAWERTELAWNRTAIAFAALGGAVLKTTPAAGMLILAMSALIFLLGHRSRPRRGVAGHDRRRPLLLITVAVTAVSLTALATTLITHGGPLRPG